MFRQRWKNCFSSSYAAPTPTGITDRGGDGMSPAQRKFLSEAANNWLGVANLNGTSGFGKRSRRLMAEKLCEAGLMRKYVHGSDEFEITDKGRAAVAPTDGAGK